MATKESYNLAHGVASEAVVQVAELTAQLREERERTARLTHDLAEMSGHVRTLRLSAANVAERLGAVREELARAQTDDDTNNTARRVVWCAGKVAEGHERLADALAHTNPVVA
jgi:ABC-type transporter Mla subunit MlaD